MRVVRALDAVLLATAHRPIGLDDQRGRRTRPRAHRRPRVSTIDGLVDGRVLELPQNDAEAKYATGWAATTA
jgi:hypothetical protein